MFRLSAAWLHRTWSLQPAATASTKTLKSRLAPTRTPSPMTMRSLPPARRTRPNNRPETLATGGYGLDENTKVKIGTDPNAKPDDDEKPAAGAPDAADKSSGKDADDK